MRIFREFGPLKRFCVIAVEMFARLLVAEGRSPLFRLYIGICESKGLGLCNRFGPNCESAQDYECCDLKCGKFVATFAYLSSQIK